MTVALSQAELLRYSRHLMIPEVGLEGQRKLKAASVLIVGTGGLGSPIALYLAAAGIGRIGLVDYDVVDSSNLQRQVIHSGEWVGKPKVKSARERLAAINPFIQIETFNETFSSENAGQISAGYDILVDGTDNFPTRYLLNDLAALSGRPYVYGSIFRFEGQVSVFDARVGPCYRCLFPEPPRPGLVLSCAEGGVLGVLPGTVGTLQATEVIKLVVGIGTTLVGKLLLYDALEMSLQTVQLRKNPNCKLCGPAPSITGLVDYEAYCGTPVHAGLESSPWELSPGQLFEKIQNREAFALVDVRDPVELQVSSLPGAEVVSYWRLGEWISGRVPGETVVAFCRTGVRSRRAAELMRAGGLDAWSLRGGINAWAEEIDPKVYRY